MVKFSLVMLSVIFLSSRASPEAVESFSFGTFTHLLAPEATASEIQYGIKRSPPLPYFAYAVRRLTLSLECPSNALYRAEYEKHIDEWVESATNWPAVLLLKSELDSEIGLFGPRWISDNLDNPNPNVVRIANLDMLMRWDGPYRYIVGDEPPAVPKATIATETTLHATIDSVMVGDGVVDVRYTLENKGKKLLWFPHFSDNTGRLLILRDDGFPPVSSGLLRGAPFESWKLFYPGEKVSWHVALEIGSPWTSKQAGSWFRIDAFALYMMKKYNVGFLGDTAVSRQDEKEVELSITLDNPGFFEWFTDYEKTYMPELPKLRFDQKVEKCTGIVCEPRKFTLPIPELVYHELN